MTTNRFSRRKFCGMAAAASTLAMTNIPIINNSEADSSGILSLDLKTHALEAQADFFANKLNLPVKTVDTDTIEIQAGVTRMRFTRTAEGETAPLYHFAFNIPENKLEKARDWLLKRTPTLKQGSREIFHFTHWDAHSIYFDDGAGNLGEFIAHHKLKNSSSGPFSEKEILRACEIALVVNDVPGTVNLIGEQLGMGTIDNIPPSDAFAAVGDRHHMLIIMRRGRQLLVPDKIAAPHPVITSFSGKPARHHDFEEYPYSVQVG